MASLNDCPDGYYPWGMGISCCADENILYESMNGCTKASVACPKGTKNFSCAKINRDPKAVRRKVSIFFKLFYCFFGNIILLKYSTLIEDLSIRVSAKQQLRYISRHFGTVL